MSFRSRIEHFDVQKTLQGSITREKKIDTKKKFQWKFAFFITPLKFISGGTLKVALQWRGVSVKMISISGSSSPRG
jgi:hypothetical protein